MGYVSKNHDRPRQPGSARPVGPSVRAAGAAHSRDRRRLRCGQLALAALVVAGLSTPPAWANHQSSAPGGATRADTRPSQQDGNGNDLGGWKTLFGAVFGSWVRPGSGTILGAVGGAAAHRGINPGRGMAGCCGPSEAAQRGGGSQEHDRR